MVSHSFILDQVEVKTLLHQYTCMDLTDEDDAKKGEFLKSNPKVKPTSVTASVKVRSYMSFKATLQISCRGRSCSFSVLAAFLCSAEYTYSLKH